jgi:hypothetical protein
MKHKLTSFVLKGGKWKVTEHKAFEISDDHAELDTFARKQRAGAEAVIVLWEDRSGAGHWTEPAAD